ncbi:MAG TPA: signal peptidase I [Stellaceae bacterium]|nr:signal peptidase I [Stellaceae bacterium]
MRSRTSGGVAETAKTLVYAIVIALFIRTFFYEPFNIPSASMVPTLLIGDYLFVSKFSYGYSRYSLPFGLPLISGRIFFSPPKRGDVVVFKLPRDPSIDYIKRVIGLPGDRVQMKNGILNINDTPVKREPTEQCDIPAEDAGGAVFQAYWETLPGGVRHCIFELSDNGQLDNTGVFVVPPDHYFMMGDNRDNSADSRDPGSGVGYVPAVNLVGRAEFTFFSTNGYAHWWEFWDWPFTIRYNRLFKAIH